VPDAPVPGVGVCADTDDGKLVDSKTAKSDLFTPTSQVRFGRT
jgi:hypothetical protein